VDSFRLVSPVGDESCGFFPVDEFGWFGVENCGFFPVDELKSTYYAKYKKLIS
jgi:hypothetical protein